MKINLDTAPDDAQIQIIPLIDVIFCILTFFILAALQLTRQQGMNVDLPQAKTGVVQMRQMLVVSIDAAGQTYIDKNPIDRTQLFTLLKEYRQKNPDGLLVLNASQNAFYNDVIQVLDVLRSVGGDKVALATIPAPAIAPNGAPVPGQNPFQTGTPGLPNVPGVTNPLLSPGTNPLSPNAPLPPSSFPGILPGSSPSGTNPTASPDPSVPPSDSNPAGPNPAGTNPTGVDQSGVAPQPVPSPTTP
jgi:biopolymer transport protein ExbD